MRYLFPYSAALVVSLSLAAAPAGGQPSDIGTSPSSRTAISRQSATVRMSPAYNPALRVPQAISTTTGVSPYQSGAYARERARNQATRNPTFGSHPANVSGYSQMTDGGRVGTGSPPAGRAITSQGTARYTPAYPTGGAQMFGSAIPSLGQLHAGGGYVSGANAGNYGNYYPASQPGAASGGHRPYNDIASPGTATDVYRRYWPLLLDRDVQGRYLLDDADVYFLTRDGYYAY